MIHDLDAFIEQFTPENNEITVQFPEGALKFRAFTRKSDYDSFMFKAAQWWDTLQREDSPIRTAFGEFAPETSQEAAYAFMISELSTTPKINQLQACKMLRAPFLVDVIVKRIEAESKTVESVIMAKLVTESKKNLEEISESSEGSSSSQVTNPTEDTPTS